MMKITHIITGLSTGGAETMLYKLLKHMDRSKFLCEVISLTDLGPVAQDIKSLGVSVQALGMSRGIPDPRYLWKLIRIIRRHQPCIVQTWMYHSDLIGGLSARLAGKIPVIWNLRQSNLSAQVNKKLSLLTAKICAWFSGILPDKILCNSEAARQAHIKFGYQLGPIMVIPNGFDPSTFKPDASARSSVRQELGISQTALVIGLVGRFDPQKDHRTFLQAMGLLKKKFPQIRCVLCGDGIDNENTELAQWIRQAAADDIVSLLGCRQDMARLTASFDIAVSSSCGESFSNAIGEAMACEVPCVVTDVGESAKIVGDTGLVVAAQNPEALALSCEKIITLPESEKQKMGQSSRQRINDHYSIQSIARQYQSLYESML